RSNLTQGMDQNHIIQQINTGLGLRSEVSQTFPGERIRFIPERNKDNTSSSPFGIDSAYTLDVFSALRSNNINDAYENAVEYSKSNNPMKISIGREFMKLYNEAGEEFKSTNEYLENIERLNTFKNFAEELGIDSEDIILDTFREVRGASNDPSNRFYELWQPAYWTEKFEREGITDKFNTTDSSVVGRRRTIEEEMWRILKEEGNPLPDIYPSVGRFVNAVQTKNIQYLRGKRTEDAFKENYVRSKGIKGERVLQNLSRSEAKELTFQLLNNLSTNIKPIMAIGRKPG